jgi:starch-binding outer membrane protein, SusD/RagB family
MKTKKIYSFLLAFTILIFACSEDNLNVPSTRQLTVTYYKTDDQVLRGLAAAYSPITNTGDQGGWGASIVIYGSLASDDAYAGGGGASDQPGYQASDTYTILATDGNLQTLWSNYFQAIYRSNILLDNVTPDDAVKKITIANAQFVKAFCYFYLSRMFGGLPKLDHVPLPQDNIPRSTLDETYTYIEDLLTKAISSGNLEARVGTIDPPDGLATIGSAQALLGKVYIYHAAIATDPAKYYKLAITQLEAVSNSGNYALTPYWRIFSPGNRHGEESIFEINFTTVNTAFGNADSRLCGVRTVSTQRVNDTIDYGWGFNQPSQDLVDAFNAQGDKIRFNATAFIADTVEKWHLLFNSQPLNYQNNVDGYWDRKHYVNPHVSAGGWRGNGNPDIVLRLGDIYLLLAEAYFQTNNITNATEFVNKVRRRAHLADLGPVTLDDIKKERRLETALEGDRYFDLIRWGDAEKVLDKLGYTSGTATPGTKTKGLFPIPQSEVIRTKGILTQNEGY